MLKIYIARHGTNVDNKNGILNGRRDEPLTDKGIEQAHEVADKIKEAGLIFDAVYASPLIRAFKTTQIISETIDAPAPQKRRKKTHPRSLKSRDVTDGDLRLRQFARTQTRGSAAMDLFGRALRARG